MAHSTAHRALPQAGRSNASSSLLGRIHAYLAVWRQRRALADLSPHMRRDIGLTEADIHREANRRFWDVPDHWRF